jgi:hypothetical protein
MKAEHCNLGGSRVVFETSNYNIRTCAANEWNITVCGDYTHADMRHARTLDTIDQLMKKDIVRSAELERVEVIAIVLYTGPMVS